MLFFYMMSIYDPVSVNKFCFKDEVKILTIAFNFFYSLSWDDPKNNMLKCYRSGQFCGAKPIIYSETM